MQRVVATSVQASRSESGSMRLRTAQDCLKACGASGASGLHGETHMHCYNACNSHNENFAICESKFSRSIWPDEHRLICSAAWPQTNFMSSGGVLQLCINIRSRSTDQPRSVL